MQPVSSCYILTTLCYYGVGKFIYFIYSSAARNINSLIAANIYSTFQLYRGDKWTYLRVIVKDGLPVARGAASVLNFNCAVILIPVCRNLINAMRGTFESFRSLRRLFDKNILFHKWCAYTICLFAAIHIGAHMFNINCLAQTTNPNADFIVNDNASPETIAFTTVPGITGLLITFSLIFMVTTAVEQIRRSYFELFWYTHHLFIVFYVALAMHGYAGFVHRQINFDQVQYYDDAAYLKDHPTGQCIGIGDSGCRTNGCENLACTYLDLIASQPNLIVDSATNLLCFNNGMANTSYPDDFSANTTCCSCFTRTDKALSAEIVAGGPKTYQWIIGPLVLYLLERLYRYYKSITRKLQVLKIVRHNDQIPVMEVQMTKVKTLAGQYAFINCPDVSAFEWHPFTLTSCPRLDYISFHIRLVGDWTCQFAERCGFFRTKEEGAFTVSQLPKIALDGPFGTSSEDIFKYEVGVCVCAGIGVTPFASLLQELFLRKFSNKPSHMRTKTVYFYWICPGFESWGWFANLLIGFEQKCIANGLLDFLKIRTVGLKLL